MPKAKSSDVKKRRVIIATILKKDADTGTNAIREKLKEYGITTTRQTVISDKNYLENKNLNDFIRSNDDLLLEMDRDMIDAEIKLNKELRDSTDDLNVQAKFSAIIRRLGVDRVKVDEKIDALRMKKLEIEKPVYNITVGTQRVVDVKEYKKNKESKKNKEGK